MQSYTGQNLSANAIVDYNQTSGLMVDNCNIPYPYYYPIYEQHYHNWYPSMMISPEKNKVELAFKIVSKLLEKKIIEKITLKQFIELVNDIAKEV